MKDKKWIKILLAVLLGTITVVSIVLMCVFNLKDSSPDEVKIIVENGHVTFSTTQASKGYGYTFKFKDGGSEYYIKSDQNLLEYDESVISVGVEVGKTYMVSVAVNGELEGGNSFYSKEVEWKAVKYLDAPKVKIENETLTWDKVANAEYYEIFYSHKNSMLKVTTTGTSYALNKLTGGISEIFVFASSSNENYLTSVSSNKLKDVTIVHEILPIITMNFTKSTATLIITVQEMFDSFMLILGDKTYTVTEFEVSGRRITCNIDYVYNGETKIGVRPLPSDIYNKYTGNVTYIDVI